MGVNGIPGFNVIVFSESALVSSLCAAAAAVLYSYRSVINDIISQICMMIYLIVRLPDK